MRCFNCDASISLHTDFDRRVTVHECPPIEYSGAKNTFGDALRDAATRSALDERKRYVFPPLMALGDLVPAEYFNDLDRVVMLWPQSDPV